MIERTNKVEFKIVRFVLFRRKKKRRGYVDNKSIGNGSVKINSVQIAKGLNLSYFDSTLGLGPFNINIHVCTK